MASGDLRYHSIDDVLRWIETSSASGALEVGRGPSALTVFFHAGKLTFADKGNQPPTLGEIHEAGIDLEAWQRAMSRPEARSSVSASLLAEGVPRDAVERFALRRIVLAVDGLRRLWAGRFVTSDAVHPFGTAAAIEVSRVHQTPTVGNGEGSFEAILALSPSDAFQVTLNGRDWTALAALLPPLRYSDLVHRLGREQADHLFTALQRADLAQIVPATRAEEPEVAHQADDHGTVRESTAECELPIAQDVPIEGDAAEDAIGGDRAELDGEDASFIGLESATAAALADTPSRLDAEPASIVSEGPSGALGTGGFPFELLGDQDLSGEPVPADRELGSPPGPATHEADAAPIEDVRTSTALDEFLFGPSVPIDPSALARAGSGHVEHHAGNSDEDVHPGIWSEAGDEFGSVDELLDQVLPFAHALSDGDGDGDGDDDADEAQEGEHDDMLEALFEPIAVADVGVDDVSPSPIPPPAESGQDDGAVIGAESDVTEPIRTAGENGNKGSGRGSKSYGEGAYRVMADLRKQMDVPSDARVGALRRLITAITRL